MVWTAEARRIHAALHHDRMLRRRARLRFWFWVAVVVALGFVAGKTKAQEVSWSDRCAASVAVVICDEAAA